MNKILKNMPTLFCDKLTFRRRVTHAYCAGTVFLFCTLFMSAVQAVSKQSEPLRLGLLPHLSNQLLLKKYQKLIAYLERSLQRKVLVYTAPDFKTYTKRAIEGRYDLYMTAPHLAAYHEIHNHHHHRVVRFSSELRGIITVLQDSPYRTLADLQGKTITTPDELAVITLLGEVTLGINKINIKKDVALKYTTSHNNALHSVADGRSDAAIAGMPAFKITNANSKLKRPLRILTKTIAIPHMMFMSPERLSAIESNAFKAALLEFPGTDEGKAFFSSTPFGGMSIITNKDMQRVQPLLLLLEQRIDH